MIAKAKGLDWTTMKRLSQVQKALNVSLTEMRQLVDTILDKQSYSRVEIVEILATTEHRLVEHSLSANTQHSTLLISSRHSPPFCSDRLQSAKTSNACIRRSRTCTSIS